ncbi:sensor histidine kinase [Micromonospora mirobrigensis]|uniref:Anti-sigma regulatory factor (Ser/Thr protein kinase) n=1 Tax=Micromonospora mirobrigensis TaxID=262898 RepID=A0A1C4UDB8_9ACTN|nr:sensor histidine kinase [Micromonospora mirobrigensis]SCE69698.1 Anti-sigma regulatory factor (Ser/Thr protein kinase) [Micromonospora mirobrigensis]
MTGIRPTGDWDGSTFAHEGFTFRTDRELIDRVVPFVAEGLSRGEPVLVVAGDRVRTLLADELGADVSRLAAFTAAENWWRGGHDTLRAYDRDLRVLHASVPTWRLVAEPVWLGREDGRKWSRYESVANRCYAELPYYSLCLHDAERLPATVLEAVARTHPLAWAGDAPVATPAYQDPQQFIRSVQPAWGERPRNAAVLSVVNPREARHGVQAWLADAWEARADDAVLAIHELVINALRVSAAAELACWSEADRLVVEVADQGPGLPDETTGYVPPGKTQEGGRGMWLAWGLADDVAVAPGGTGARIRLYFSR